MAKPQPIIIGKSRKKPYQGTAKADVFEIPKTVKAKVKKSGLMPWPETTKSPCGAVQSIS